MHRRINSFEVGERVDGFYLIRAYNLRTSSNNKKYLDLILADASGEINAKLWDVDEETEKSFGIGDIIKLRGDVTLWQDQLQFKIIRLRHKEDEDDIDLRDIVPSAPLEAEEMYDFLMEEIHAMKQEDLRKLAQHAFSINREKILYYPAAMRNHHAVRSGLLYHLYRMVKSGKHLATLYELNWELLLCGILLHDIEKLNEMNSSEFGIVSGYSDEGILLGHIITGIKKVEAWGKELNLSKEVLMMVEHMILSHHYHPEYGSPKKPMFPEAELLHHLDMIDARMYDMHKALKETEQGFSEPIFSLDRRRVYKSPLEEDND